MTKKEEYQEYLAGEHWHIVRESRKDYDKHRCVICGCDHDLEVHHLTYANKGNEPLQDLITVCRDCHQMIHDKHNGVYQYDLFAQHFARASSTLLCLVARNTLSSQGKPRDVVNKMLRSLNEGAFGTALEEFNDLVWGEKV